MTYRLIDLFSGAGGMTLGFVDHRYCGEFKNVLAVDNDAASIETHKANFTGDTILGNIEDWLIDKPTVPAADVVIGGPPCQGFSLLNKNRTGDERRTLWEQYLEVVRLSGAKIFVMENVAELFKSEELSQIRKKAKKLGFSTEATILNTANYGAPQTRKRTIVLGWRTDLGFSPDFPPAPTHAEVGSDNGLPRWRTVRDAIGNLRQPVGTEIRKARAPYNLHFGRNPTAMSLERYQAVPPGGNRFDLQRNAPHITPACWIRKESGGTDLFGRLWWDRPSVTIRTEFFKPEKGRYLHPDQHRPITHREAARLMGFPDDFAFMGSKTEIARQIGNAVPPDFAGAIARMVANMLGQLEKPKKKTTKELVYGEALQAA
jgi:DNA (cytosine-5)-methyltransferase 1